MLDAGTGEVLERGPLAALQARAGDYAVTIKDAAKICGTCSRTIWREIERGKLRAVRYSEKRTRILASELARYLGGEGVNP